MNFSPVQRQHLPECAALFANVFNNPPWNEKWETQAVTQRLKDCYHTPGFYGLLIHIEGETCGFALGFIERWDQSKHFYLKEMCITSEQQRRGLGTALLNALEADLTKRGVEKMYLLTGRETPAQAFYEKQGFHVNSRMIMMTKALSEA